MFRTREISHLNSVMACVIALPVNEVISALHLISHSTSVETM